MSASPVLNYDAPFDLESYTHRIGRTGRAGREGDAIIFVTNKEMRMLNAIERTLKVPCDQYIFPALEEMNQRREEELFAKIEEGFKETWATTAKLFRGWLRSLGTTPSKLPPHWLFLRLERKACDMRICLPLPANKDGTATTDPTVRSGTTNGETAGIGVIGKTDDLQRRPLAKLSVGSR